MQTVVFGYEIVVIAREENLEEKTENICREAHARHLEINQN